MRDTTYNLTMLCDGGSVLAEFQPETYPNAVKLAGYLLSEQYLIDNGFDRTSHKGESVRIDFQAGCETGNLFNAERESLPFGPLHHSCYAGTPKAEDWYDAFFHPAMKLKNDV